MDLVFTPDEVAFRDEVRRFCESQLPAAIRCKQVNGQRLAKEDIVAWQRILNRRGWAAPLWPKEAGGL